MLNNTDMQKLQKEKPACYAECRTLRLDFLADSLKYTEALQNTNVLRDQRHYKDTMKSSVHRTAPGTIIQKTVTFELKVLLITI